MTRFKVKPLLTFCVVLGITGQAWGQGSMLSNDVIMPCERTVEVENLTRIVVPMTPFRGVNLIFPFELADNKTSYSLSSDQPWAYEPAAGSRMVPVYFSQFGDQWGELADFTIATGQYVFSMTLKADPNIENHCTNIVFNFSEEQLREIREGEKKEYLAALDSEYQEKLAKLDEQAEREALKLVGSLARGNPDNTGIHEYEVLELSNGDEIELYVEEIQGWGEFSVVSAEITNDSDLEPLYIEGIEVGALRDDGGRTETIEGYTELAKKLKEDSVERVTFTTLENIPYTDGYMKLTTNRGSVEVKW